jgi:hypothetical protein
MSGTDGPDTYRALARQLRAAHVPGRQLRSVDKLVTENLFDEVDIVRTATAGLGAPVCSTPSMALRKSRRGAGEPEADP